MSKWKVSDGAVRLSQELRLKSERMKQEVFEATMDAAQVGEDTMRQVIVDLDRIDTGNMLDKVRRTTESESRKATSVEAKFGWLQINDDDYYFKFQEEGFRYVHGKSPHRVPGMHAMAAGAVAAREYLQQRLQNIGLRRSAKANYGSMRNRKYGG